MSAWKQEGQRVKEPVTTHCRVMLASYLPDPFSILILPPNKWQAVCRVASCMPYVVYAVFNLVYT